MPTHHDIALRLPLLPRWVEVRDLLTKGMGEVIGYQAAPEPAFVLLDENSDTVFVIGEPDAEAIQSAVRALDEDGDRSVLAPFTQAARLAALLPGWVQERIYVYTLPDMHGLPALDGVTVAFVDPVVLPGAGIFEELLDELLDAAAYTQIAAVFINGQPVSFCYAGAETDTLWDVAIDTLPDHQRRGYAGLAFAFVARHKAAQGRSPVWQALESNTASWRLALKLGFIQVDEVVIFTPAASAASHAG